MKNSKKNSNKNVLLKKHCARVVCILVEKRLITNGEGKRSLASNTNLRNKRIMHGGFEVTE